MPTLEEMRYWRGIDWALALKEDPDYYAQYCDWSLLGNGGWVILLEQQPQFIEYCDTKIFHGANWRAILRNQPQLGSYCYWEVLDSTDWNILLIDQPTILKRFPEARKWYILCQV